MKSGFWFDLRAVLKPSLPNRQWPRNTIHRLRLMVRSDTVPTADSPGR